jgi:putative RNA 2'-phosphotransferase
MGLKQSPKLLSKFLSYILGRRPDEFGLVPDSDGFVKIKECLKVLREEEGWRYVRRTHMDEIMITIPNPAFETKGDLIRAKDREHLPKLTTAQNPPKLLYTYIRRKAYPFVLEKGISPSGDNNLVVLSASPELAERIGRRSDQIPVELSVSVKKAVENGVVFFQKGETLFLAEFIPADCFTGPPLPRERLKTKQPAKAEEPVTVKPAGSFFLDPTSKKGGREKSNRWKKQKDSNWKHDRKKINKRRSPFS